MKRFGTSTCSLIVGLLMPALLMLSAGPTFGQANAYDANGFAVSQPPVSHGATASGPSRAGSQRVVAPSDGSNNTWVSTGGARSGQTSQTSATPSWKSGQSTPVASQSSRAHTTGSPWMRQAASESTTPQAPKAWSPTRQGSNSAPKQATASRKLSSSLQQAQYVAPSTQPDPFEASAAQRLHSATSRASRPAETAPAKAASRPRTPRTLEARPATNRPRHSLGTYNPLLDNNTNWGPVVQANYHEELPPGAMVPGPGYGPGPRCSGGASCGCEPDCGCDPDCSCEPDCGYSSGGGYDPLGGDSIFGLCAGTFCGRSQGGCTCGDSGCGDEVDCACEPGCGCDPGCGDECGSGCDHGPGCIGDGCDWVFIPVPVPRYRHLDLYAGVQGFKGPLDFDRDRGNFGFHEGFNLTRRMPLSPWPSIGMQIGYEATQNQLSGSDVGNVDSSHSQGFLTLGGFRRVHQGLQFGAVWDVMHDERTGNTEEFHQIRGEIGIVGNHGHEIGLATAIGMNDQIIRGAEFGAVNQYLAYYRVNGPKGSHGRFYGGFAEDEQAVLGADFQVPVRANWSVQGSFGYLIPEGGNGGNGAEEESWNVGLGLVWHTYGRAHRGRCDDELFRPLFNVANNGTMFVSGQPAQQNNLDQAGGPVFEVQPFPIIGE